MIRALCRAAAPGFLSVLEVDEALFALAAAVNMGHTGSGGGQSVLKDPSVRDLCRENGDEMIHTSKSLMLFRSHLHMGALYPCSCVPGVLQFSQDHFV